MKLFKIKNQNIYEVWVVSAFALLIVLLFIGTLKEEIANNNLYLNITIIAFINVFCASIVKLCK